MLGGKGKVGERGGRGPFSKNQPLRNYFVPTPLPTSTITIHLVVNILCVT